MKAVEMKIKTVALKLTLDCARDLIVMSVSDYFVTDWTKAPFLHQRVSWVQGVKKILKNQKSDSCEVRMTSFTEIADFL